MAEPSGRPAKIVSFGFKHGFPNPDAGTRHAVIDVRGLFRRNPHRIARLRPLTGLDVPVQEDLLQTERFNESWGELQIRVLEAVRSGSPLIYLGCTGGRHRSVYLVDRLGKEWQVEVEHRDMDKG